MPLPDQSFDFCGRHSQDSEMFPYIQNLSRQKNVPLFLTKERRKCLVVARIGKYSRNSGDKNRDDYDGDDFVHW